MKKTICFLITLSVMLAFALNVQALVDMNDIVPVFPGEEQSQIEGAVIEGAAHFLAAQSHANLLLKEYEMSAKQPFNFSTALDHAENTMAELKKSTEEYVKAITMGKQAGYVEETLQKFKNFNYDGFTSDKQMNSDMMVLVKSYFSGGNILGAYQQKVGHLSEILVTLEQIKEKLTAQQLPDVSLFWQLLQQFSKSSLFGNYCTMTASEIFAH